MEASRWNFREFPVLLRRYDLAGHWGTLESTPRHYKDCDEIPLMVKTEYDVALHAERPHQQEQEDSLVEIGLHIKEEDDFVIKTEDEIGAVGIKQELDIGPMVLQSKTVSPLLPPSTFVSSHPSPPAPCVSVNSVDRTTFSSSLGISHDEDTSIVTVNEIQNQIGEKLHRLEYYDCNASKIGHAKEHIHTHAGHRPYKCNRCEYSTFRMHTFKVHRCTHKTEELYKCDVCEYSTSRMTSLKEHMRTHIEDKPYKCAECDYSTSRMASLKEHMRTHKVEKAYKVERFHKCEECGYSTRRRDSLKRHMSTHTGEKPYKCEYCEYCASQSGHITAHMRIHTGEKPYKCEECGYSTTYSGNLMTHRRTHTGEKPHSCEYCEYKTSRRGRLYTHYFESHFRSTQ